MHYRGTPKACLTMTMYTNASRGTLGGLKGGGLNGLKRKLKGFDFLPLPPFRETPSKEALGALRGALKGDLAFLSKRAGSILLEIDVSSLRLFEARPLSKAFTNLFKFNVVQRARLILTAHHKAQHAESFTSHFWSLGLSIGAVKPFQRLFGL